ncbi:hypothetical protein [[Eubacterium] cellulosolvens]
MSGSQTIFPRDYISQIKTLFSGEKMKLKGRHFLSLQELESDEILQILRNAIRLKKRKKTQKLLKNKSVAMIFQKPSTRTSITAM